MFTDKTLYFDIILIEILSSPESEPSAHCISRTITATENYGSLRRLQKSCTKEEDEKTNNTEGEMKSKTNVERLAEENNQLWREVGRDLRHIADTFTVSKNQVFIDLLLHFCDFNGRAYIIIVNVKPQSSHLVHIMTITAIYPSTANI